MDKLINDIEIEIKKLIKELTIMERSGDGILGACSDRVELLRSFLYATRGKTSIDYIRSSVQDRQNRREIQTVMEEICIWVNDIKGWYGTRVSPMEAIDYNANVERFSENILKFISSLLQLLSDSDFRASLEQINALLIKLEDV